MNFAQNFKRLRIENNYTQEEVARKLNMSLSMIQKYEANKFKPRYETIIKICELYKIKIEDLIA